MNRRELFMCAGAALTLPLIGCASEGPEAVDNDTTADLEGEPDVAIIGHEPGVEEGPVTTYGYAAVTVENRGGAPTGPVRLQANWYDEEDNYLENDTERLFSLAAGEQWNARVYHQGTADYVDDYEIEGDFDTEPYVPPDGLRVVDSRMYAEGGDLVVDGEIENESGEDQSYVEAIAKISTSAGHVLGDAWTNVTDLRAGETWAFSIDQWGLPIRHRPSKVDGFEILISDSAL